MIPCFKEMRSYVPQGFYYIAVYSYVYNINNHTCVA